MLVEFEKEVLDRLKRELSKETLNTLYHDQSKTTGRIATMFNVRPRDINAYIRLIGIKQKKNIARTEHDAINEMLAFYQQHGQFKISLLMYENSGLAKFCSKYPGGTRGFCKKHNIEYILVPSPSKNITEWDLDSGIFFIRELYQQLDEAINILDNHGVSAFKSWIHENGGILPYLKELGINNVIENQKEQWTDAKCFRLVKEYYQKEGHEINPNILRKDFPEMRRYIYKTHGSFEGFIMAFDLKSYISVNTLIYDDENMKKLINDAYKKKGGPVSEIWLRENGYYQLQRRITRKGNGSFLKGCNVLGILNFIEVGNIQWDKELALKKVKEMLEIKGAPLMSFDFVKLKMQGLRGWINTQYGSLHNFFVAYNMPDSFINMAHIGFELWCYGIRFQELVKDVIEIFFNKEEVKYNKWVENNKIRPDFVIVNNGLWIDAKLSSYALKSDESIYKYIQRVECKQLWIIYLRGPELKPNHPNIKMKSIKSFFSQLNQMGYKELVEKIINLEEEINTIEDPRNMPTA